MPDASAMTADLTVARSRVLVVMIESGGRHRGDGTVT
jgi:hypothetical protein